MSQWITYMKQDKWKLIPIGLLTLLVSTFLITQSKPKSDVIGLESFSDTRLLETKDEEKETLESIEASETTILVDVKGAVQTPGLYSLPTTARVHDAIQAAGGLTSEAEPLSINLAQKLHDEAMIYVTKKGEEIPLTATAGPNTTRQGEKKVNLNTASEAELQTIPGIGAKKAADILAYRENHGRFKSVDDLKNVSGIGEKSLEKLRAYVSVDE